MTEEIGSFTQFHTTENKGTDYWSPGTWIFQHTTIHQTPQSSPVDTMGSKSSISRIKLPSTIDAKHRNGVKSKFIKHVSYNTNNNRQCIGRECTNVTQLQESHDSWSFSEGHHFTTVSAALKIWKQAPRLPLYSKAVPFLLLLPMYWHPNNNTQLEKPF